MCVLPHSFLLSLTLPHSCASPSLFTPLPHSVSLLCLTPPHSLLLCPTLSHSSMLCLTPPHSASLRLTPYCSHSPLPHTSGSHLTFSHPPPSTSPILIALPQLASLLLTAFWAFCIMHQCLVALPPARNTDAFFRLSPANKDTFQAWTQLLLGKISFLSHSFPLTFPSLSLSLSITYRTHSALCSAVSLLPTFCPFCFLL